jgi:hypothetical protein
MAFFSVFFLFFIGRKNNEDATITINEPNQSALESELVSIAFSVLQETLRLPLLTPPGGKTPLALNVFSDICLSILQ